MAELRQYCPSGVFDDSTDDTRYMFSVKHVLTLMLAQVLLDACTLQCTSPLSVTRTKRRNVQQTQIQVLLDERCPLTSSRESSNWVAAQMIVNRMRVRVLLNERRLGELLRGMDPAALGASWVSVTTGLLACIGDIASLNFMPVFDSAGVCPRRNDRCCTGWKRPFPERWCCSNRMGVVERLTESARYPLVVSPGEYSGGPDLKV